jgi:hypothetical protein
MSYGVPVHRVFGIRQRPEGNGIAGRRASGKFAQEHTMRDAAMKPFRRVLACAALFMAVPAAAQDPGACDRQCLIDLADTYVAALVAHDPGQAPLAEGLVTVENLQRISPGQGLWTRLGAKPGDYAIHVPDPVSQQVGIMAVANGTDGKPLMFGIRLKLAQGAIVEAEHLIGNPLGEAQLANLQRPRPALLKPVPEPYRDSRGRLIWIGLSYYDALDLNNGSLSPMADDCVRHENGFQTARNSFQRPGAIFDDSEFAYLGGLGCEAQMDTNMWEYIDRIDHRRVEIADVETGLVWGMSHFRHAMAADRTRLIGVPGYDYRDMSRFNAFDMPAIHIYKVWGGQIHEIEAVGLTTTYMSATGRED